MTKLISVATQALVFLLLLWGIMEVGHRVFGMCP